MEHETTSDTGLHLRPTTAWAVCIVLVVATAIADGATGPYFHFDFFYLVPSLIAARSIGRKTGLAFALVCAALSVALQLLTGHPFRQFPLVALWAGVMRLGAWGAAVWLVSERQRHLQRMESLVAELGGAMSEIKQLRGMLPVCAWCKRVRAEGNTWLRLEDYLQETTNTSVTHSICPECAAEQSAKVEKARG